VAAIGIAISVAVYAKGKAKPIEPKVLADGWYYDRAISGFMGGPGRKAFEGVAMFDATVVDGAVIGTAKGVGGISSVLRKVQSGFVRTYAAVIGIGAIVLLAWFILRGVI